MNKKGLLVVISGFAGTGKGTIVKQLVERYGYKLSISCTTRLPREGEMDGREYHFKTKEEFENLIDYNGFIEYARYVENYYGTPRAFVEKEMANGSNVLLEIEVQGAQNIKRQYPDAVLLFISPPSAKILRDRLVHRGTETMEVIEKRMSRAAEEADSMAQYDYIVVNDDLETCIDEVHGIICAEAKKACHNQEFIDNMKEQLTK